mgnify:CR=1 FL=1
MSSYRNRTILFSKSRIDAIPASPKSGSKVIFWDTKVPGLGAYRTASGYVSFVFQFRSPEDARSRRITLGKFGHLTLDQVRGMAAEYAFEVANDIDPIEKRKKSEEEKQREEELVLANYVAAYLERRQKGEKPHNRHQLAIINNDVVGLLGDKRMDRLTVKEVEAFGATLEQRAVSAKRMGLVYLKSILNDAKWHKKIKENPVDTVQIPKAGERTRRLNDREIVRFLEAARDIGGPRGDILEMLLRTLKRKSEISEMTWSEIDLDRGIFTLPASRSKNRTAYDIPLSPQIIAIIERQQPDESLRRGPVFTLDGGKTTPVMGSQVKNLLDANMARRVLLANERDGRIDDVEHFTVHDLRTTAASRLQEAPFRYSSDIIDLMLLHSVGGKVTKLYQRSQRLDEISENMIAWNDWIDGLMASDGSWPGGKSLPVLKPRQMKPLLEQFRRNWPQRSHQKKALDKEQKR